MLHDDKLCFELLLSELSATYWSDSTADQMFILTVAAMLIVLRKSCVHYVNVIFFALYEEYYSGL
jgi:hypothetical protein